MRAESVIAGLVAFAKLISAAATPENITDISAAGTDMASCNCGMGYVIQASKEYGCKDGQTACACNGWDEIYPVADAYIMKYCPAESPCAKQWACGMCHSINIYPNC